MPSTGPAPQQHVVQRLLDQVNAGVDVVVSAGGEAGQAVLDAAAASLAGQRYRVLQVASASSGSLSGLMARVAGQPDLAAQDDEVLERGFKRLTVPDADCDRIALLINDAHLLQRPALRFIQFACRAGAALRLVIAGEGLPGLLAADDFASLRARLTAAPELKLAAVPVAPAPAMAPMPAPSLAPMQNRRRLLAWSGVGLGMAASVALGFWAGRANVSPGPAQHAVLAASPPTATPEAQPTAIAEAQPTAIAEAQPMAIPDQPAAPPAILAEPASVPAVVEPQDHPKTDLASAGASAGPVPPPEPGHAPAAPATARARAAPPLPKQLEARPKDLAQSLPSPPPPSRSRAAQLTRGYAAYPRPNDEPEDPYAQPSYGWRPASPRAGYEPGYSSAPPYIGTYTTDGYGVRTFRFGP